MYKRCTFSDPMLPLVSQEPLHTRAPWPLQQHRTMKTSSSTVLTGSSGRFDKQVPQAVGLPKLHSVAHGCAPQTAHSGRLLVIYTPWCTWTTKHTTCCRSADLDVTWLTPKTQVVSQPSQPQAPGRKAALETGLAAGRTQPTLCSGMLHLSGTLPLHRSPAVRGSASGQVRARHGGHGHHAAAVLGSALRACERRRRPLDVAVRLPHAGLPHEQESQRQAPGHSATLVRPRRQGGQALIVRSIPCMPPKAPLSS
jgi:hypothetical protein